MTAPFTQTNMNTDSASNYKSKIDANFAALSGTANQFGPRANPPPPTISTTPGGSFPARTYYVRFTYWGFTSNESNPSEEVAISIPANYLLVISPPVGPSGVYSQGWNPYVGISANGETRQATNVAFNSSWTEPSTYQGGPTGTGLVNGAAMPQSLQVYAAGGTVTINPGQLSNYVVVVSPPVSTLNAAHATLVRYDRLVAGPTDSGGFAFSIITGTAGAGIPALTAGVIPIATIKIPAASTQVADANITDDRPLWNFTMHKRQLLSGGANPASVDLQNADVVTATYSANTTTAVSNSSPTGRTMLQLIGGGAGGPWSITLTGLNNAPAMPLSLTVGKSTYLDIIGTTVVSVLQNV